MTSAGRLSAGSSASARDEPRRTRPVHVGAQGVRWELTRKQDPYVSNRQGAGSGAVLRTLVARCSQRTNPGEPMPSSESTSRRVRTRRHPRRCTSPSRTVVWVRGDQDATTRLQLSVELARAAGLRRAEVVVDLSGVTFMDASTIGALVVANNHLLADSCSLSIRNPSLRARRLLELCELTHLIDDDASPAQPTAAPALRSWVEVPVRDRSAGTATRPANEEEPSLGPARVPARHAEPARSIRQSRAPS